LLTLIIIQILLTPYHSSASQIRVRGTANLKRTNITLGIKLVDTLWAVAEWW